MSLDKNLTNRIFRIAIQAEPAVIILINQQASAFGTDVSGQPFAVQKLAPLMNRGGAVVLTTSIANVKGMPTLAAYGAAKAALRSFARVFAAELLPREIRVNAVDGTGRRGAHSTRAFCTLHHKRTGEGALSTSIALDPVYSRQIAARLRANQGHDVMAFRPLQPSAPQFPGEPC